MNITTEKKATPKRRVINDVVVVGSGVSGLVTAYWLTQKKYRVHVLEAAPRTGGVIASGRKDGMLWETGPNSAMDTTPLINELLYSLNIRKNRADARRIADTRFIVRNGQLIPLPMSGGAFFTTRLFSVGTKLALLREPFISRSSPGIEETVSGFVRRRLGKEFLDYAIEPFVAGVFAGDPDQLSVQAAFPKLFELEQRYGGLIRGLIFGAGERKRQREKSKSYAKSFSFNEGMQTLTDALSRGIEATENVIETNVRVTEIARSEENLWIVRGVRAGDQSGEDVEHYARSVVLATPAYATATLLASLKTSWANTAAHVLHSIPYAPVSVVVSGWQRDAVGHPLDGFGFLVPRKEKTHILGTLFSSSMFNNRADRNHVVLTTFVGGMRHPELATSDDNILKAMAEGDLASLIDTQGKPLWSRIFCHPHAIPQYTLGHLDRVQRVDAIKTHAPGLFFCANWRGGIAISDCIKNGHQTAKEAGHYVSSLQHP